MAGDSFSQWFSNISMSLETGLAEPEPESSYWTSLFLGFLTGFCDEYMSYITNVSRKVHGTFKKEKKKSVTFFSFGLQGERISLSLKTHSFLWVLKP